MRQKLFSQTLRMFFRKFLFVQSKVLRLLGVFFASRRIWDGRSIRKKNRIKDPLLQIRSTLTTDLSSHTSPLIHSSGWTSLGVPRHTGPCILALSSGVTAISSEWATLSRGNAKVRQNNPMGTQNPGFPGSSVVTSLLPIVKDTLGTGRMSCLECCHREL